MSVHLTELNIENFRGIKKLELNKFSHINIISGINNSGKTSILEAILSLSYTFSIDGLYDIAYSRGDQQEFKWLFNIDSNSYKLKGIVDKENIQYSVSYDQEQIYLKDLENYITEKLDDEESKKLIDKLKITNSNNDDKYQGTIVYNIQYSGYRKYKTIFNAYVLKWHIPTFDKYSIANYPSLYNFKCIKLGVADHLKKDIVSGVGEKIENMQKLTELLKIFDSNIETIGLTVDKEFSSDSKLTIKHKIKGEMPISVYGDGIKRIISLADAIICAENGILLIDEIETSVHKSVLKSTFEWLIKASKEYNVQVFLTTHSLEACDTILETASELKSVYNEELVSMITLFNVDENIVARVLDGEKALKMRENYDMELR